MNIERARRLLRDDTASPVQQLRAAAAISSSPEALLSDLALCARHPDRRIAWPASCRLRTRRGQIPYDPGRTPSAPAPKPGEQIIVNLPGLPPYKDIRHSIRNVTHPRYEAFVALRGAATAAMAGRCWYHGPVALELTLYAPRLNEGRSLTDYAGGVMDTLDGSHGATFTYLPIAFEDDCQVAEGRDRYECSDDEHYTVIVRFLPDARAMWW